jgi:hypothetical protein
VGVSRRALSAALLDRHFGNGAPTWPIGRGKSWARPSDTSRMLMSNAIN